MGVWLGPRGARELVIYKPNDTGVFTGKTCTWRPAGWSASDHTAAPEISYTSSYAEAKLPHYQPYAGAWEDTVGILVTDGIPLAGYNKVVVDYTDFDPYYSTAPTFFFVSSTGTDFNPSTDVYVQAVATGARTAELDVSALPAGTYYFGIAMATTGGTEAGDLASKLKLTGVKATK